MQFHNKRDTQKLIESKLESKWRLDSGDEVIIKRAQYDGENGGFLD